MDRVCGEKQCGNKRKCRRIGQPGFCKNPAGKKKDQDTHSGMDEDVDKVIPPWMKTENSIIDKIHGMHEGAVIV